jgi:hypothetical protein
MRPKQSTRVYEKRKGAQVAPRLVSRALRVLRRLADSQPVTQAAREQMQFYT